MYHSFLFKITTQIEGMQIRGVQYLLYILVGFAAFDLADVGLCGIVFLSQE
jgi:hypothetical protein